MGSRGRLVGKRSGARKEDMEQAIDNRLAEACQKSAAATLGFEPKHH